MPDKSKKLISDGVVLGKKFLSFAEKIILELIEQAEDMGYMRTHAYAVIGRDVRTLRRESEEGNRLHEEKMKRQAIKRLREEKFIKLRQEGDKVIYELTTNGKVKALKIMVRDCRDLYYDNRVCLVAFDFPEAAKAARKDFRRFLKSVGFAFVQGSVWSIKKNVETEMKELIILLKIKRWVEVYEARQ